MGQEGGDEKGWNGARGHRWRRMEEGKGVRNGGMGKL